MAAGSTYTPIATTTLANSTTAVVTFNSISGSYTDLVIVVGNLVTQQANQTIGIYFNGSTSGYSYTYLNGNGSSASSGRATSANKINAGFTAGTSTSNPSTLLVNVMNYSNSTTYKTALLRLSQERNGSGEVDAIVGLYPSTSAITSLSFALNDSSSYFTNGTVFTIYGILAA